MCKFAIFASISHDQICTCADFAFTQNDICTWSEAGANFPIFAYIARGNFFAYVSKCLHMDRFAYMCKLCIYAEFAQVEGFWGYFCLTNVGHNYG